MRHIPLAAAAGVCLWAGVAGAETLNVGDVAPEIKAAAWFNVPGEGAIKPGDLRGQVVMIEFWGTY